MKKPKKSKLLKTRLIIFTAAIIFLTAVLNMAIGIYTSYDGLTKNVESDLKTIGETASVAIDTSLNNIKINVQNIAKSNMYGGMYSKKDILAMLNGECQKLGYKSISLVDSTGTIMSTDNLLTNKNIQDKDYFTKALQGDTYITSTTYDINNNLCILVCTPVQNGIYQGVIMASLDPQTFSDIIKNITVGKTGNVFMLDKEGTIIANIRPDLVTKRTNMIEMAKADKTYATAAVVHKNMTEGKSGVEIYTYETGDRICYYEPISDTDGWSYGAVAPISEMTSTISYTVIGLCISSAVCIILGIILTAIASHSITKPITKVCRRLELLSQGDLHTDTVTVRSKDETGDLAAALNTTVLSLRTYITEITETLREVSLGNMTVQVNGKFEGDFAPIKESLDAIMKSLNSVLTEINESAIQVASGAEQVSNGSQTLAQGATEQASSIEELSASITEISQHVKNNADNAVEAMKNVETVNNEIQTGSKHMEDMVSAMSQIKESSNQIGKIIKTIEDIAFQTNILALNAAVEAARAGAAGKGFAVVADEVRNLASKSAEAAKNTTELIDNSLNHVKNGADIADQTEKSLQRVVESVNAVTATTKKITEASNQQAQAIEQVTLGVDQISSVVQTNSATAEESAAASEELSNHAQVMKSLVGNFKLSNTQVDIGVMPQEFDIDNVDTPKYTEKSGKPVTAQ